MSIINTKVVRLISGEELMGVISDTGESYKIKDVCQIATSYADPTSATARIGLAPFLPYTTAKDGIEIKEDILNEGLKDISNSYDNFLYFDPTDLFCGDKKKCKAYDGLKLQSV